MKKKTKTEPRHTNAPSHNWTITITLVGWYLTIVPSVYAAGDPLTTLNNLSDFIFAGIRALGIILLAWGIVKIGMSLQSHDPSQRSTGFLTFFGGLVIAFTKEILDLIMGS